jgi:hypothetical protein
MKFDQNLRRRQVKSFQSATVRACEETVEKRIEQPESHGRVEKPKKMSLCRRARYQAFELKSPH